MERRLRDEDRRKARDLEREREKQREIERSQREEAIRLSREKERLRFVLDRNYLRTTYGYNSDWKPSAMTWSITCLYI